MPLTEDDKLWINEQLERVETSLLTEFHKWASPVEARQRTHAAAIRALDVEMESLNDRVKKLEGIGAELKPEFGYCVECNETLVIHADGTIACGCKVIDGELEPGVPFQVPTPESWVLTDTERANATAEIMYVLRGPEEEEEDDD
jgi:hypothetical protein